MAESSVQVDLDLDEIQPEPKHVKIAGEIIEIHPAKFKDLLEMMAVFSELQNLKDASNAHESISKMSELLNHVAPQLKDKGIELTIEQYSRLMTFIFTMATPSEQKELQEAGIGIGSEKKTDQTEESTSTLSPTS